MEGQRLVEVTKLELFSDELLAREVVFRGGTALHEIHFNPPGRYSEDIDLVQVNAGPLGPLMHAVRAGSTRGVEGRRGSRGPRDLPVRPRSRTCVRPFSRVCRRLDPGRSGRSVGDYEEAWSPRSPG